MEAGPNVYILSELTICEKLVDCQALTIHDDSARTPAALVLLHFHPFFGGQARSLENAAAAAAAAAPVTDPSPPPLIPVAGSGAFPARLASPSGGPRSSTSGAPDAGDGHKRSLDRLAGGRGRQGSSPPPELVRETLGEDGEVSNHEAFRMAPAVDTGVKKGWVTRRGAGGGNGEHVCTLVPGATAMFEVAATAPEKMIDGTVKMEVRTGKMVSCVRGGQ